MPKSRKPATLQPLRTLRIFCEGQKTEPTYFRGYISHCSEARRKSVVDIEPTKSNTPVQLVEEAIQHKNSREAIPNDEYWVVFDRESPAKYDDRLHATAFDKAEAAGVKIALSNVCFEYWILLHFINTSAPYSSFAELKKSSKLDDEFLARTGEKYEKAAQSIFDVVKDGLLDARRRGVRINANSLASAEGKRSRPFHLNPFVGIVDLLDAIDKFE